ncbi:MAG TPA: DUF488 family protein [Gemmataceae bacterium]
MIKTKRWDDRRAKSDGFRLLICRYRPRALPKAEETWDLWWSHLGPSKELHAAYYGKHGQTPVSWEEYRQRYLDEMKGEEQQESIALLAEKVAAGKTITLLCSSACTDASRCHRTLLKQLIEEQAARLRPGGTVTAPS